MLNRKTREYTVMVVVLLLLVMAADIRGNYRIASSVALAAIISYWTTKNALYSIYASAIVLFLFYLSSNTSLLSEIERFENINKLNGALEDVETRLKPKDEELGGEPEEDKDAETTLMEVITSKESLPKIGDASMQKYSDKIQTHDLAKAQKETFEMVNAVKQLKDVVTSVAPVLKEGKKVIEMVKGLNLVN